MPKENQKKTENIFCSLGSSARRQKNKPMLIRCQSRYDTQQL